MITPRQFKNGMTILLDGTLYAVVFNQHIKPGKGGAFVRTKLKCVDLGTVVDRTFRPDEPIEQAFIESKKMLFTYRAGDTCHFMDLETYDEVAMSGAHVAESLKFLKDNVEVDVLTHKNRVIEVKLPIFVDLKVVDTEPGLRGDTARQAMKPATLQTGAVIQVPLFVNKGEVIRIDTRTGEYSSRA